MPSVWLRCGVSLWLLGGLGAAWGQLDHPDAQREAFEHLGAIRGAAAEWRAISQAAAALSELDIPLEDANWRHFVDQRRADRRIASLAEGQLIDAQLEAVDALVVRIGAATENGRIAQLWESLLDARDLLQAHNIPLADEARLRSIELIERAGHIEDMAQRARMADSIADSLSQVADHLAGALPEVGAFDVADDDGGKITIFWRPPDDGGATLVIQRLDVTAAKRKQAAGDAPAGDAAAGDAEGAAEEPEWETLASDVPAAQRTFTDDHRLRPGHEYKYRLLIRHGEAEPVLLAETPAVKAWADLFHGRRLAFAIIVAALCLFVFYYIRLARSGRELNIRKIAGLEAVDDAVGRATEMGRPIMFIPGIQDMNDIQTVAGITILGRVARVAAERDALLEVPTSKSLVMTASRETVHSSYMDAGRPDAYDEKKIYYTTDEQFGYVAAVTGAMVREKPATCFYMGAFFAESLILAETANMTGSIQIAGTAQPAQLPFFVAACDYTLIGEEFFAASAYLSGEPEQLGSLKGQDVGKLFALVIILVAALTITLTTAFQWEFTVVGKFLDIIRFDVLQTS